MRPIDADALKQDLLKKGFYPAIVKCALEAAPTIEQPTWISCAERLPENGKEGVLIALRWGEVDIGWCEDGRWSSEFVNEYEDGEVTHWMSLPEPPKGVE